MAIQIDTIETTSLGDRSYLVRDGAVAVVVDPQRDIDRVLAVADEHDVRISHVVETHVHNDYVSGGLELARESGATYVLPVGSGAEFSHTAIGDAEVIETGRLRLSAVHTPGHTHHHVAYVLADDGQNVHTVFTGGSMLYGATGRTDLVTPDSTLELTRAQYHSVRRLAETLPPDATVLPTHGFGSFCSATPSTGDSSTVGEQREVNPALTLAEQEYVDTLLAGLDAFPAYYAQMGPINRRGPGPIDLSKPEPVQPSVLRSRIEAGQWVIDLRERTAFAAGHLGGSLGFELATQFVTYLGWLHRYGEPITLIGESPDQIAQARRELARIGIDDLAGAATAPIEQLAAGHELSSYPVSDFAGLAKLLGRPEIRVLDTRRNDERARGYVAGSQHIPLPELEQRLTEIAEGQVWVYCGSGFRASIATSILDRAGRDVVLINDDYDAAVTAGLQDPAH